MIGHLCTKPLVHVSDNIVGKCTDVAGSSGKVGRVVELYVEDSLGCTHLRYSTFKKGLEAK